MRNESALLRALGRKHAYEILTEASREPKRFKDLEKLIPNKRTLSNRLQELSSNGLLEKTHVRKGGRYLAYRPTKKGAKILETVAALE